MAQFVTPVRHLPLKNDDRVQEVYADALVSVNFTNGNFHLTFASVRTDHSVEPPSTYRHVIARLVVPANCAVDMQTTIARVVADLQKQEVLSRPASLEAVRH